MTKNESRVVADTGLHAKKTEAGKQIVQGHNETIVKEGPLQDDHEKKNGAWSFD
ncbi:hypothetical protein C5167_012638 [Papaver somniferum]|uniref:Uncharacterized protein n=1 Tax=Papaver somniferum TaxID=3469 RepID=A0A4Y7IY05_PAPSO|nr:hypothetical protein C5167_012638 [Papaver somniferum]